MLLLDLCAAFDTLDHDNLLERLNNYCRVSGKALDWFASFLSEIAQSIQIASWSSTPLLVPFGVPQESVFEGDLFLELVSTLPAATSVTGVTVDQFFDDTQARVSFKPTSDGSEQQSAFNSLSSWAANANIWYIRNRVKLNSPKSTIIVTNTKRRTSKQSAALPVPPPFSIDGTPVEPSTEAKNLGVIFDNQLSMALHIRQVCKTSFYHIWRIGRIRHLIDTATTKCLINAFVLSRIDYANSLYLGLPGDLLDLLQRVLNAAARLTMKSRKCERITPHLKALKWLPVRQRIALKVAVTTYRCLNNTAPPYLSKLLKVSSRDRRTAYSSDLLVPKTKSRLGDRAFSKAAPALWNSLPLAVKTSDTLGGFRSRVFKYLSDIAFS